MWDGHVRCFGRDRQEMQCAGIDGTRRAGMSVDSGVYAAGCPEILGTDCGMPTTNGV